MATTTMHFGPEWMRKQPTASSRPLHSDPQPSALIAHSNVNTTPPSGASTYSALLTPATIPAQPENRDITHPFRYSKEEMISIYKEGGGKSGLGLEVERWEGIVREVGADPVGLKELGEAEKKLFAGSLNSEMRRRQSTDYLMPLSTSGQDRSKLNQSGSSTGASPMRERFGSLMGQRRRDSTDREDQSPLTIPRKLSVSSLQAPLGSPRDATLPSPRNRTGPGFDGVLGSSESWVSRRRGSESKLTAGITREPGVINGHVEKTFEIKEEVEETPRIDPIDKPPSSEPSSETRLDLQSDLMNPPMDNLSQQFTAGHTDNPDQFVDNVSVQTNEPSAPVALTEEPAMKDPSPSPSDLIDLSSIEWSYVDPNGQVQGPFRADRMQSWYDQGYFTKDLLMKRTSIDSEWVAVGELERRATLPKIFLSPWITPPPSGPPGLARPPDDSFSQRDTNAFASPYRAIPGNSLPSSTLESYINGASNMSDSPSSSFSAGGFGAGSPGPATFGARNTNMSSDHSSTAIGRRSTYVESTLDPATGLSSLTNSTPVRAATFDNHMFPDHLVDGSSGGQSSLALRGLHEQTSAGSSPFPGNDVGNVAVGHRLQNASSSYAINNQGLPFTGSPSTQYPQHHPVGNLIQPISPLLSTQQQQQLTYASSTTSQSPWGTPDLSGLKRPGPFDTPHPTVRNTAVKQASSWERNSRAPWNAVSQIELLPESRIDPEHSLTVSNLEQHNQQHLLQEAIISSEHIVLPASESIPPSNRPSREAVGKVISGVPNLATISSPDVPIIETQAPKGRRKVPLQVKLSLQEPAKPPSPPLPSSAPQAKAAWSKEDEAKASNLALGFREIQEAEAKKAEARKIIERERERAARAVSVLPNPNEESATFTASWGLPTSQVHGNRNSNSKEATSGTSPNTVPVWTSVSKPVVTKKTMKEIQEEEEKRKKIEATKEKETVSAAVRRAYAESTNKFATVQTGSAWTTVGSNGKPNAIPASTRPVVTTTLSSNVPAPLTVPRSANGIANSPRPPSVPKASAVSPKVEEIQVSPSHEFLRWLGESLKGLNPSVNLEDIISMLLSFPLDADTDSSTMEIISDLIYASSTTLDGRRFASEFVNKRKVDAASRPKGTAVPPGKPPSIADVVKTQPKPAQNNEWGGFKVVNKKKKGVKS